MIIGLVGRKQSGKSTAADVLRGFGWEVESLAAPLKQICQILFGLNEEETENQTLKELPLLRWPQKSPRYLMQLVGTDMLRAEFPDIWIRGLLKRLDPQKNTVVPDVRFINEAKAINDLGGYVVAITRPGLGGADNHLSETELRDILTDRVIVNEGTVTELQEKVLELVEELSRGGGIERMEVVRQGTLDGGAHHY